MFSTQGFVYLAGVAEAMKHQEPPSFLGCSEFLQAFSAAVVSAMCGRCGGRANEMGLPSDIENTVTSYEHYIYCLSGHSRNHLTLRGFPRRRKLGACLHWHVGAYPLILVRWVVRVLDKYFFTF